MYLFSSRSALLGIFFIFSSAISNAVPLEDVVNLDGTPLLPENFRSWEFLGTFSGLAPDKNGSHEMHTVYASPGTVEYYQENAGYPDGAVLVKEVLETHTEDLTTGRISYATKTKGWFVWIKDKKNRFPESKLWGDGWGWAFYAAGDKPILQTTDYKTDCLGCHVPAKETDYSYIRGYPVLGVMYRNGEGVPEDDKQAVKWYRLAAEQGDANAQYNLGIMYANGYGVPEDKVFAYLWWNLAAANGHENASKNKGIVAKRMTSSQIVEAQKLSRKCLKNNYKNC